MTDLCPCGSGLPYGGCCAPFHLGTALPATPVALMRSRYSAFALGLADYLEATLHPEARRPEDRVALEETLGTVRWIGLRIVASLPPEAERGEVEFVAFHFENGQVAQLHERSLFLRQAGCWSYRSGRMLPPLPLGRNDDCPCGSGKKFKKCHGDRPPKGRV